MSDNAGQNDGLPPGYFYVNGMPMKKTGLNFVGTNGQGGDYVPTTAPWYSGNYRPPTSAGTGGGQDVGYNNTGNSLIDSLGGQANGPNQIYFGGTPQGAAGATQYYQGMAGQAQGNAGPSQIGDLNNAASYMLGRGYGAQQQAGNQNQYAQGQQANALGMLGQAAAGNGPSAAQAQLQQGLEQGINSNMAMAASARGPAGLANAQKNALASNGQMAGQTANNAAQLRAQEQQAAMSQYGQLANAAQNQYAQQQLGFGQQNLGAAGLYGQAGQLQAGQNALNQQGALGYQQLGFNSQAEALQAAMANQQANENINISNAKNASSGLGGILGAVGGAFALSDRRAKTNVKDASSDIDSALNNLGSYSFDYADARLGDGRKQTGVMAQELAANPATAHLVTQEPHSGALMTKGPETANFALSAAAHLNDRLNQLEGGGQRLGSSHLREPGGGSSWTLREEPNFILAKNDRTGELQKVATEPLSPSEERQAKGPHGAGPISEHADFSLGGLLGGGGGGDSTTPASQQQTVQFNPANAATPAMMGTGVGGVPLVGATSSSSGGAPDLGGSQFGADMSKLGTQMADKAKQGGASSGAGMLDNAAGIQSGSGQMFGGGF